MDHALPETADAPEACPYARPIAAIVAALATVSTVAGLVALTVMTALV